MRLSYCVGWMVGFALIVASGCSEEDTTPPAPPWVDDVTTPTSDSEPRITGTAEFGATVRISGGAATVETIADPYTAKWAATVGLAEGSNTLSVTATDAAGNESAPTTVNVEHILAGTPAAVVIDGPPSARAGDPVTFEVTVIDVFGDVVPDAVFTLTTDAPMGSTTFTAPSTFSFCDPSVTTVTAQVGTDGPMASTSIDIDVGPAVTVALTTTPSPAVIDAGETVDYSTATTDSCGNATADVVSVFTNAPGAIAANGTITGLVRAGSWTIVAEVPGTSVVDAASLLVSADESTTAVVLTLTSMSAFVGIPIGYTVTAVDGFGNPVTSPPVITVPTDVGAVVDTNTQTITFASVGSPTHTVTATVGSASDSVAVIVTNPDVSGPTVVISSPTGGTVFPQDANISVTVDATDDQGLAQIFFQATGARDDFQQQLVPNDPNTGLPRTAFTATFDFDVGGSFGDITLVAQAVDTAGNHVSSTEVVISVDPAANINVPAGFTIETVSFRASLNGPRGLTVDGTGMIYVANNGGGAAVLQIDPISGNQSLFTPSIGGAGPEDIVYYPTDDTWFLTARGSGLMYQIDDTGVATTFTADFGSSPRGVIIDSATGVSSIWGNGMVRRFDPSAAPLSAPVFTMDADPTVQGNPYGLVQFGASYAATDEGDNRAYRFDAPAIDGDPVINDARIAEDPPIDQPRDMALAPNGLSIYVANQGDGRLVRIDIAGCVTEPCPTATLATGFNEIWGLAFDANGDLLITDEGDDVVFRMSGPF